MPIKTTPKDFFLHLGVTIALYASVIALIRLCFTVINRALPDALSNYFSVGDVVWPISMLIVLVPILYILEWLSSRDIRLIPEKIDLWIRKWRIYLTIFLTGATISVSIITLINTYLSGEITSRFLWKIVAIIVISAVVLVYYILAKSARIEQAVIRKSLAIVGLIIVLAAIVAGFVVVGSPADLRAFRFDDRRVSDLNSIQYQIIENIRRNKTLPESILAMNDAYPYANIPKDPETGDSYEYNKKSAESFEICATFSRASKDNPNKSYLYESSAKNENWNHEAGRVCFDRKIDLKQLLPNDFSPVISPIIQKPYQ